MQGKQRHTFSSKGSIIVHLKEGLAKGGLLLCCLLFAFAANAQNSKKVKDLQKQRDKLQQELKKSQQDLTQTRQEISTHQRASRIIGEQLEVKLNGIREAEIRMAELEQQMEKMQNEIALVDMQLQGKRNNYARALRMARAYRHHPSPTLFVLSAKTLTQMSRRARNTNFFATVLRTMGEELLSKQGQLLNAQNDLLAAKNEMNNMMRDVMTQRHELGVQQIEQQRQIANLDSKQKGLQDQLAKQRNQLSQLNKKIDQVVAAEVEAARKRAEAARKKEEAKNKKNRTNATTGKFITTEDKQLNGSFEQNKGRLPIPLTGSYMIGERFGTYNVPGMKNVQLDNKGTNYIGKPGARARSVFDGEVTAVFQFFGTKGVLIRHGSYISVYCNLSSVIVSKGQKVHARDLIGTIATNEDGKCVLHFQLRKETTKLNPEAWISK